MEDTKVPGVREFECLGSAVQKGDGCGREVERRVRAGWSRWRGVSGVVCDRRLPARVRGRVCSSVVRPAMVCGLERWRSRRGGWGDGGRRDEGVEVCRLSGKKRRD